MRIIKLGHYDCQFECEHCHTIYQCSTDEMCKNENMDWEIKCPVCNIPVFINENSSIYEILKHKGVY